MGKFKSLVKQYLTLCLGLTLMAIAVALSKLAGLGTSPISSIPNVVSLITPLTIGQVTIVFMVILILLEAAFLRHDFSWWAWLQLVPSVIFGVLIDAFTSWLKWLPLHNYGAQLLATFVSIVILAWGVYFEVNSHTILMAGEGIVTAAAIALHRQFPKVKVWSDGTMVVVAVVIALIGLHGLVGVREGTVLSALITGRLVNYYTESNPKLTDWLQAEV
ncbi:YczE/YyaS/YitT family protein [Lactiplantibacillus daowaiensis]